MSSDSSSSGVKRVREGEEAAEAGRASSRARGGVEDAGRSGSADVRLSSVRASLSSQGLSAVIVPSADPHHSEYVADAFKRRAFVTRFDGSAGTAAVTPAAAALWTDGRYWAQAGRQLGKEWALMKDGEADCPVLGAWLAREVPEGGAVGYDPWVTSADDVARVRKQLDEAGASTVVLRPLERNPVDEAWGDARPALPAGEVFALGEEFAGLSAAEKLRQARAAVADAGANALLVCKLDEVAWLLNLRGTDVQFNPVFYAYAVVRPRSCVLYLLAPGRLAAGAAAALAAAGVEVRDYSRAGPDMAALRAGTRLLADPASASDALVRLAAEAGAEVVRDASPLALLKAVKSEAELAGMRRCHVRDAAAVTRFMAWLEAEVAAGRAVDEVSAADRLERFRALGQHYRGLSFETISASGPNGAVIHYAPRRGAGREVGAREMYLLDSGAQYLDGTTDITRTVHLGQPTEHERRCFTMVLRGHLALARAVFPPGTPGPKLDALARGPLWRAGLDYGHGTGHGVGAFLNVHEGPHGISSTLGRGTQATVGLRPGMSVTNEPGYYEDGAFGIRIESVMLVRKADTEHNFRGRDFYEFDTIALVPLQAKLVVRAMLEGGEEEWVDAFHRRCWDEVSPLLVGQPGDEAALEWLRRSTRPLAEQLEV